MCAPVEVDIIDTSQMARQLVHQLLTVNVPNVHIPDEEEQNEHQWSKNCISPVRATSSSHATIWTPGAVEQILLKVVRVAGEDLFEQLLYLKIYIVAGENLFEQLLYLKIYIVAGENLFEQLLYLKIYIVAGENLFEQLLYLKIYIVAGENLFKQL